MFEVGQSYRFVTLETGDNLEGKSMTYETSIVHEVSAVEGTLVKCLGPDYSDPRFKDFNPPGLDPNRPRDEIIINTASLFFVRAEKQ
ncbi:hypothetical protein CK228_13650 [Mesorhizobium sp. WSM4312]|uniref:hypothetical protein n=1 Tax=Mesorhizobium sp. WSM4312 TaxID=2029411 RepID=UPI000BB06555|nr:hypothetical protein [Mesorhizobium sp. WSM4312]PBB68149.1 hypothetical protein CK228_13650 [Mesorhizobium sp. WSM4312]